MQIVREAPAHNSMLELGSRVSKRLTTSSSDTRIKYSPASMLH